MSKHKQKMGPVLLNIKHGRLFEDWEETIANEVADYKAGNGEICSNENYVRDPPNVMIFNVRRLKFDTNT